MTRINCIDPQQLSFRHLVAEYREITRVFALSHADSQRDKHAKRPEQYTMGKGHVLFFYDKLGYISRRFAMLWAEMLRRGYNPTIKPSSLWEKWRWTMPKSRWGDWLPDADAVAVNMARLVERDGKHYGGMA